MEISPIRINYGDLASSYENELNTKLRGFDSGYDFLQLWVHDDDDNLSIVNMIESASSSELDSFILDISKEISASVDVEKIQEMVRDFANLDNKVDNDSGIELKVSFLKN